MRLKVILNGKEDIDLNRIDNLHSLSQSTSDNSKPQYGIVPNTGSINLVDIDGKFEGLINSGELPASSSSADIYIDEKLVQKHITTDSTYEKNGNELTISLSNSVDILNNTVFSGIEYGGVPLTAYDVLFRVFSEYYGEGFTDDKFKELMSERIIYGINDEHYGPIYSYLQKITIEYPYIESGKTYKSIIDDFCAMTQLQMYVDTDGYIKATSARPVIGDWDFVISDLNCQMSDIKEDLFVKNKYNGIEIPEKKFTITEEQAVTVAKVRENIENISSTPVSSETRTDYDFKILKETLLVEPISYFTYIHSECKYYTYSGSETFNKKQNNNLENIISVYSPDAENLPYSLTYKSGTASATANITLQTYYGNLTYPTKIVIGSKSNESIGSINFENKPKTGKIEDDEFTFKFTDSSTGTIFETTTPSTFPSSLEKVTVTDNGETFTVDYTIVCKKVQTTYRGLQNTYDLKTSGTKHISTESGYSYYFNLPAKTNGFREEQYATALEINISGEKYTITFNEDTIKTAPTSGVVNVISYPTSSFITDKTKYEGVKISSLIADKVLSDYSNGVKTAEFTTTLNGLSTLHGYNGKVEGNYLIELGDIVYPRNESDGSLWWGDSDGIHENRNIDVYKTTGFNLVYDGEILNELELIKVKYVAPMFNYEYDESTDGYTVTSNPEYSHLTQIVVPETYDDGIHGVKNVSVVGDSAFKGFSSLENIVLPSGLKKIWSHAFNGCSSLKSIILPQMLTVIAGEAFANCTGLTSIDIPSSVTTMFSFAFVGVSPNMVIYCNTTSKPDNFYDYWNAYDYNGNELETVFISSLTFEDDGGTWKVTGLTDTSIKHLTIPNIYNGAAVTSIADSAFANNNTLRTVKIGNNVTAIGANAFNYCRSLYQVELGSNVSSIGSEAFRYCDKLVSVMNNSLLNISAGSTDYGYIGYYIVSGAEIIKSENFVFIEYGSQNDLTLISYDGSDSTVTLPDEMERNGYYYGVSYDIHKYAFWNCEFETVNIGSNITSIEDAAFYNCSKLKKVNIDENISITSLPSTLFYGCSSLTDFAIPSSVTTMGNSVFDSCSSLKKVYIPKSVTTINATQFYLSPFRGCSSTTKIYCGATSKPSGWGAYWNYYSSSGTLSVLYGYTKAQYETK